MAKKNYLKEIGGDVYEASLENKRVIAAQEGVQAPAPEQAAPQGGGQQVNPEQFLMDFLQAVQNNDEKGACEAAMQFTAIIAQQYQGEQQANQATPGMRKGGHVKNSLIFSKDGKIK